MTPLEVINKVEAHLVAQGKPARVDPYDPASMCRYRTVENLACGVGCLIDDELAHIWDMGTEAGSDIGGILSQEEYAPIPEKYHWMYKGKMPALLVEIQQIHDNHDIPRDYFVAHIQHSFVGLRAKFVSPNA